MDLAIKKAKAVGVGWVCAKNSNHYGNTQLEMLNVDVEPRQQLDVY